MYYSDVGAALTTYSLETHLSFLFLDIEQYQR